MRVRVRRAIPALVVLSVASACGATYLYLQFVAVRERATYKNVSVAEAKAMMESTPSLLILDVSSEGEYAQGHLKGAINIPLSDLLGRINEFDMNSPILVYCRTGKRSAQACSALVELGFTRVYNMEGGIVAWMNSGYPVVIEKVVLASSFSVTRRQPP